MKKIILPEVIGKTIAKYRPFLIVMLAGLLLLLLPRACEGKTEPERSEPEAFDLSAFEERLERILAEGEGVGRVKLVLTLKSTMENVYAEEARTTQRKGATDSDWDSDRQPSIVSNGAGGEVPVTIKQIYPEFLGATVVCDGAENPRVLLFLTEAVASLTGIPTDHITIIKMKQ